MARAGTGKSPDPNPGRTRAPEKTRPETRPETQRRPVVRPLGGAEVLVAVRGPSPGEGGGKKGKLIMQDYKILHGSDLNKNGNFK